MFNIKLNTSERSLDITRYLGANLIVRESGITKQSPKLLQYTYIDQALLLEVKEE